ncbi:hypothetical protein L249_7111 [Ophiocordyceps polyrhachis-furcata BCC 54312]|uniref:Nudix hydrolase domain-containing protein n=1 Tax=Ophiocordyceps polyrhachis-furcata BCC 54312 TaxID=1330021 RepID=A0A367LJD1_9HYPO|nr:hypothetical protein L249_7111 [Ophiocordyceps polyrhachis-furcata BCC 54312]
MLLNIDVVNAVDKSVSLLISIVELPYGQDQAIISTISELAYNNLHMLLWEDDEGRYPIGYILDRVVRELLRVPVVVRGHMDFDENKRTVLLFQLNTEPERTRAVAGLVHYWRDHDTFKLLQRWRGEVCPIYGRKGEILFSVERAAVGLFGTVQFGAHLTAYVTDASAPYRIKLWVAKRAANKTTFPGMLDNTVAGGLATGENPFDCILREADEEASLSVDLVSRFIRSVGTVTYIYITDEAQVGEDGFIYPECQWVYDLNLPANIIPQPKDGEAEQFFLCDVDQIGADMADGRYKPNSAIVLLDFFIRHGIIKDADNSRLDVIKQRIHRNLPFPGPHEKDWYQVKNRKTNKTCNVTTYISCEISSFDQEIYVINSQWSSYKASSRMIIMQLTLSAMVAGRSPPLPVSRQPFSSSFVPSGDSVVVRTTCRESDTAHGKSSILISRVMIVCVSLEVHEIRATRSYFDWSYRVATASTCHYERAGFNG